MDRIAAVGIAGAVTSAAAHERDELDAVALSRDDPMRTVIRLNMDEEIVRGPVAIDGEAMTPAALLGALNTIGGENGVGRVLAKRRVASRNA